MSRDRHLIQRVGKEAFVEGDVTAGMAREAAITLPDMWSGLVHTEPGVTSGWHHHGDHDSIAYLLSGAAKFEFGPDGTETVEAEAGDFVHIPADVVHREGNPSDATATIVLVRRGTGPVVINVDGPQHRG